MSSRFRSVLRLCRERNSFLIPSAWSLNLCRGVKSYEEIPRARFIPFHGCLPYIKEAGGYTYMHKYIDNLHKTLGPIFIAKLNDCDIVYIADPNANLTMYNSEGNYPKRIGVESWRLYLEETGKRRGLFFMDNEEWHEIRKVFNRIMFRPNSMADYVKGVSTICQDFIDNWKIHPPMNLKHHVYCWNVECIGEIVLGKKLGFVESLKQDDMNMQDKGKKEFVEALFQVYVESANLSDMPSNKIKDVEVGPWKRFCEAMGTMLEYGETYVQRTIEDCKIASPNENIKKSIIYKALIDERMDEDIIKAVVNDIFLGSPDTTSHTAIWALYLLGRNPEVANKAREEIFSVLKKGESITLQTLLKIPYLDAIIREALRLYSAAPFINRTLPRDIELCDYLIPAGTTVMSSLITMGRDPNNFADPLSFKPERWWLNKRSRISKSETNHERKAFTPFAIGARSCIGKYIAEADLALLIMEALKNFEWTVEEEVDMIIRLITVPKKDIKLKLKPL